MKFNAWRLLALLGLAVALATTLASAQAGAAAATDRYIVQLADPPLASYRGGIDGLAPTNPAALGQVKLDPTSTASKAYVAYLDGKRAALKTALAAALGRTPEFQFEYRYALNGFAASLTDAEAVRVASLPGVVDVQKDFVRELQTDAGPKWIGAPSIWDGSATGSAAASKGEGVVVGVIDTGINHDHPSFADIGGDGYDHTNPRGRFFGLCDPVLGAPFCNDKLIGVHDFTGTTPLDDNQHGSHTASTAAGNVVDARLIAPTITIDRELSGVAPHANLITYKACIAAGCLGASLAAAIDQATLDGVDVINYSIGGGPSDPWDDADSESFLGARDAGIFVAASAGNDGSRPETVGSPANSPWLLSVGASTHNRTWVNSVTTTGGSSAPGAQNGAGVTSGHGPAPIVHAADYGDRLCGAPFAPGTFKGEIVVCVRGVNPRVEKGRNVKVGGAGGMVLVNSAAEGESTVGDAHELPAVHLGFAEGKKLTDWLDRGGSGLMATISGSVLDESAGNGDVMAGFSSRGPNKPVPGVLKPDVTAPGVDVLAAIHTTNPAAPPEYGILSGTSMSSPHAAGSAALVRALHSTWTPAEVQSALMTTATQTVRDDDGVRAAGSFAMGAGRIDLTKAGLAGLTLDESTADFVAANPANGGDPSSLNLASLASAGCEGTCTWTRTVTSRAGSTTTWRAQTSGPRGLGLTVAPDRFTLEPGATQAITVTANVAKLALGQWLHAALTLKPSGGASVPATRLPIAIRTGDVQSVEAEGSGTSGSTTVSVTSNVEIRELQTRVFGLTKGDSTTRTLEQDPTPTEGPYDVPVGTFFVAVDAPAGSRLLATEIVETDAIDIDLFVGRDTDGDKAPDADEELCRSASATAIESCKLGELEGGTYWVLVQNWLGTGANEVKLATAVVGGSDAGNLTVTGPTSVPAKEPFDLTLSWNEPSLAVGEPWFGFIELGSDRKLPNNAKSLFVEVQRTS